MRILHVIPLLLLLSACASSPSISEYQCMAGDWHTVGYRDAKQGLDATRLLDHQEACGEFGVVPDRDQYAAGWREGVESYCTADNGFYLGRQGKPVNRICSGPYHEPYASAHADGWHLYSVEHEVRRLESTLARSKSRLTTNRKEMVGATTAQLTPDLTAQERVGLVAKLESLADERAKLQTEIEKLEAELVDARAALDRLNQTLALR